MATKNITWLVAASGGDFTTLPLAIAGIGSNFTTTATGSCAAGSSTTVINCTTAAAAWVGHVVSMTSGVSSGQSQVIGSVVAGTSFTLTALHDPSMSVYTGAFTSAPGNGDTFTINDVNVAINNSVSGSTGVSVAGITTSSIDALLIQGTAAFNSSSALFFDASQAIYVDISTAYSQALYVNMTNVTVKQMQFRATAGNAAATVKIDSSGGLILTGCLIANASTGSGSSGGAIDNKGAATLYNCVVYNNGTSSQNGLYVGHYTHGITTDGSIWVAVSGGPISKTGTYAGQFTAKNCAFFGGSTLGNNGTFTNCVADLSSFPGSATSCLVSQSFSGSVQSITNDFRAKSAGALAGAGIADSNTPFDIYGTSRGSPFTVGAQQLVTTATDFSISGGSNVVPGGTTSNFSIQTTSGIVQTANCVLTLSDGGVGGTFTPSSVTINIGSSGPVNFTWTAPGGATPGTVTITATATNGSSIPNGTNHGQNITVLAPATSYTLTPSNQSVTTSATTGNYTVSLSPANVPHGGVTVSLALSGTPGGSLSTSSLVFTEGGTASGTFTYTSALVTGTETITPTNSALLSNPSAVTATVTASPLVAGALSLVTTTTRSVSLSATSASGGIAPYTNTLYRSESLGFPGFNGGTAPSSQFAAAASTYQRPGLSGLTPVDRSTRPSKTYQYFMKQTDSSGASVYTNIQAATSASIVGCFIGDSITAGFDTTPGTGTIGNATGGPLGGTVGNVQTFLKAFCQAGTVTISNSGVGGTATSDWTSTAGGSNWSNAVTAFTGAGLNSTNGFIMSTFGANDASTNYNITTAQYLSNYQTIIANAKSAFPGVPIIINCPPWYNGPAHGAPLSATTMLLMQTYTAAIAELVDNVIVFQGDVQGITIFNASNDAQLLFDHLHPNDAGAIQLGFAWTLAILRVMFPGLPQPQAFLRG